MNDILARNPRLTAGLDLVGEFKDSGFDETPYLVRRSDGQFIQLTYLLFLVANAIDGMRDLDEIARLVSEDFGRTATADDVRFLIDKRLVPLGIVQDTGVGRAEATPEHDKLPRLDAPLLGLKYRLGIVPETTASKMTAPFLWLFRRQVVVAILVALIALDVWLLLGHGIMEGARQIIYQPSLLLLFIFVEIIAMAWHELGHATACRYGGAKPGVIGAGLYIIWFVFYSDVTDSYRLDRTGRLRTDAGGLYFDAIFTLMLAGAYFVTGFEPLLVIALLNQLSSLDELSPFLRLDGYYILSDLTGVADPFGMIKPTLKSLIPGRATDPRISSMKPWVRVLITVWVLAVVPGLILSVAVLILYGPWLLSTAWDSITMQYASLLEALDAGNAAAILLSALNLGSFLIPFVGGTLTLAWIIKSRAGKTSRLSTNSTSRDASL